MTIRETQQYIEKVRRELTSVGTSVPAVKKALKKINAELEKEKSTLDYEENLGRIPGYALIEKRKDISEKEQIVNRVYEEEFESLRTPRQIEFVERIAKGVPGSGKAAPVQKFFAGLLAFFFVIAVWSAVFIALYFFAIKDSDLGKNSLLGILGTLVAVIFILEIAFSSERVSVIKPLYKISRFIYRIFFDKAFLFFGGSRQKLEEIRMRRRK